MTIKDFDRAYKERGAYHVHASGFDAWFLEENYSKIAEYCSDASTILDLGCGEGRLSDFVKLQVLDGIDNQQSALDLNRECYGQRYRRLILAHLRDLGGLHLGWRCYDRIVCSLTLMYLTRDELVQCLKSARCLLKDDGRFVATYPNATSMRGTSKESYELSASEVQRAFREAAFDTEKLEPVCPFLPRDVVKASYVDGTAAAAKQEYLLARSRMDMANSYHFLITAKMATLPSAKSTLALKPAHSAK